MWDCLLLTCSTKEFPKSFAIAMELAGKRKLHTETSHRNFTQNNFTQNNGGGLRGQSQEMTTDFSAALRYNKKYWFKSGLFQDCWDGL